jgi:hypothetical protein
VAALLLAAAAPRADTYRSSPYVGVTVIDRAEVVPRPVRMHIALIDTRAPGIRFKVSPPGGTREVVRQTTRDFLKAERAQVAINGHFFLPFPSADADAWVIGLAASEGRVYSAFETPEQNYALVADAPALNIDTAIASRRSPRHARGRRPARASEPALNVVAGLRRSSPKAGPPFRRTGTWRTRAAR